MNEIESFFGPIENTADALRVFELCRQGQLGRVRRRLHDKERRLIRSGSVFVFDEQESGIRRWTDGRLWSPSRILGNFLIYRELERRPANMSLGNDESNEKYGAGAVPQMDHLDEAKNFGWLSNPVMAADIAPNVATSGSVLMFENEDQYNSFNSTSDAGQAAMNSWIEPSRLFVASDPHSAVSFSEGCANSLLGPNAFRLLKSKKLQASAAAATGLRYSFKPAGLIKKTISARVDGRMQHLICYFSEADFIRAHSSQTRGVRRALPELLVELRKTPIPADLVLQQNFRKQPTTECGFPLGMEPMRTRRRHSMHAPSAEYNNMSVHGKVPICPRVAPELLALDLETAGWPAALQAQFGAESNSTDVPPLLPEHSELDAIMDGIATSPLDIQQAPPLHPAGNIMEECLRMVLGSPVPTPTSTKDEDYDGQQGLCIGSSDPALPIMYDQDGTSETHRLSFDS